MWQSSALEGREERPRGVAVGRALEGREEPRRQRGGRSRDVGGKGGGRPFPVKPQQLSSSDPGGTPLSDDPATTLFLPGYPQLLHGAVQREYAGRHRGPAAGARQGAPPPRIVAALGRVKGSRGASSPLAPAGSEIPRFFPSLTHGRPLPSAAWPRSPQRKATPPGQAMPCSVPWANQSL